VWITPHAEREPELAAAIAEAPVAEATSFVAEFGAIGDPQELVAAAWDLAGVREHYLDFIEDFARARPSTAEACFRMQTLLVHAWRKFPFLDPDLPAEVLPADWPRKRAHDLFLSRHERWAASARAHFESLESELGLAIEAA
jgi:phenylacetic acid degradation operon negative regulatory protein